jgi:glycosyltransferase involved in cell wall biosynthesis
MSKPPTVSVLIVAYNREKYIGQAIESVLGQTFTDFELVVVDDCSRDRTAEVARSYETDPRVRVVVNERNLGDYPNRNQAAKYARGMFLKYHDSDDVMYPYCLEVMVRALESEPRAAFALSSNLGAWRGGPCPMLSTPILSFQREFLGYGSFFETSPTHALFRADAFRSLGGFPEIGVHSDVEFYLRACAKVNILLLPADLCWYRVHPGRELSAATGFEKAASYASVWKMLNGPACPLSGKEQTQAKRNWCFLVAQKILHLLVRGKVRLAMHLLKGSSISLMEWARYLRWRRRSRFAGAPVDDKGEFLVPNLLVSQAAAPGACAGHEHE